MPARKLLAAVTTGLWLLALSGPAAAFDLDLNWGHVTTYWERINDRLMAIAETNALDFDWVDGLAAMEPAAGEDRTPQDVTEAIAVFRQRLDRINESFGVGPAKTHDPQLARGEAVYAAYLDSGYLLDSMILAIIENDPVQVVGQYYPGLKKAEGGLPGAYGQVDLANRRIQSIIDQFGY